MSIYLFGQGEKDDNVCIPTPETTVNIKLCPLVWRNIRPVGVHVNV